jgi:hypothetical protein
MMEAMAPQPEMPMEQMAQGGLAELDTGNMYDENNYATGGIVAFDDGGPVKHYAYGGPSYTDPFKYDPSYYKDAQAALMKPRESIALDDYIINQQAAQRQLGVDPDFYKKTLEESKTERLKELEDAKKMDQAQLLLAYSSALTGTPTFGGALAKGSEKAGSIIGSMGKTQREINSMYKMADRKTLEAQQAQARGDASGAMKAIEDRNNINTNIAMKNAELETSAILANAKARYEKAGVSEKLRSAIIDKTIKDFTSKYPQGSAETVFSGNPQLLQQEWNRYLNYNEGYILRGEKPPVPGATQIADIHRPVISGKPGASTLNVPKNIKSILDQYPEDEE